MRPNELLIEAGAETVWALTIDIERWPGLTPTITEVTRLDDGPIGLGSRARIKQPGQPAAVWTVTTFTPGTDFVWENKVGPVTMVGGHHLEAVERGCVNRLTLDMHGRGSRLLERLVGRRIAKAIDTENRGFKRAAEGASAETSG